MSDLIKNVERSMFTFNLSNITEICFEKTFKTIDSKAYSKKLTDNEKAKLDNCIDKYLLAFNIVKEETNNHIESFFTQNKEY